MFSNEEMRDRYQRASDYFCHTQLDLPTPVTTTTNQIGKMRSLSSSSTTTTSNSFLDQTRTTRHSKSKREIKIDWKSWQILVGCQTRLTLPPAADLDSLIQSFTSNGDIDDPPIAISNSSLNNSQIRRKLFSDDDDLLDETPPLVQPRRSSSFDVNISFWIRSKIERCSRFSFSLDIVRQVQVNNKLEKTFSFNIWNQLHPIVRLYLSKPQPIRRKILDLNYLLKHHNKVTSTKHFSHFSHCHLEAVIMTSVSRPTHYLSLISSPVTNMSIGSPFIHPHQMPSMSSSFLFIKKKQNSLFRWLCSTSTWQCARWSNGMFNVKKTNENFS